MKLTKLRKCFYTSYILTKTNCVSLKCSLIIIIVESYPFTSIILDKQRKLFMSFHKKLAGKFIYSKVICISQITNSNTTCKWSKLINLFHCGIKSLVFFLCFLYCKPRYIFLNKLFKSTTIKINNSSSFLWCYSRDIYTIFYPFNITSFHSTFILSFI